MDPVTICRYALSLSAAAALLPGCGGSQPPTAAPETMARTQRVDTSAPDGFGPSSRLVPLNGALYGTTFGGGAGGQGTIYRMTTRGEEKVVYSFAVGCPARRKCADGTDPTSLVGLNGVLYGTTGGGGSGNCAKGCGTFFSATASGQESVLYSYNGGGCGHPHRCADARFPNGLTAIHGNGGTLFGASWYGGECGQGTVFSVTTSGVEKVLKSFSFGKACGAGPYPYGRFADIDGTLYGTDALGGAHNAGFVFSISKTGRIKVLYSFDLPQGDYNAGLNDGLIDVNGVLYGATANGGTYNEGTVFSLTTRGVMTVVYSFGAGCQPKKRCSDGEYPDSSLIAVRGTLYGVTSGGGKHASGTLYGISTSGSEKVLYNFRSADGVPEGVLTHLNSSLWGTTNHGICGGGMVFGITFNGLVRAAHSFC
jgi:uncharacterized repeat protein (TIGR03803 family)